MQLAPPFLLADQGRLVLADAGWFEGPGRIAKIDADKSLFEINVKRDGKSHLAWMIDTQGMFYALSDETLKPRTFLQRLGLKRRVAFYQIAAPVQLEAAQLLALVDPLQDPFVEAPNATDMKKMLQALPADQTVGPKEMKAFFGTPAYSPRPALQRDR